MNSCRYGAFYLPYPSFRDCRSSAVECRSCASSQHLCWWQWYLRCSTCTFPCYEPRCHLVNCSQGLVSNIVCWDALVDSLNFCAIVCTTVAWRSTFALLGQRHESSRYLRCLSSLELSTASSWYVSVSVQYTASSISLTCLQLVVLIYQFSLDSYSPLVEAEFYFVFGCFVPLVVSLI